MLTVFSTPKPFVGQIKVIQANAIRSWALLRPACEVILFGDEEGTAEIASELGVKNIIGVERNEYGTPLVSSMFRIAQDIGGHNLMCYINADIILMSDFLPATRQIKWHQFLLIGQRWDIDWRESVDFNDPDWEGKLRAFIKKKGKLHAPSGLDYFVFPRGVYPDVPAFTIGRPGWDNWMVYQARAQKLPVIDATRAIMAVHQNHDYAHHPDGKVGVFEGIEAERNRKILGGWEYSLCTKHATWMLTPRGLRRALTVKHLYAWFQALPVLKPRLRFLAMPKRTFIRISKFVRSKLGVSRY